MVTDLFHFRLVITSSYEGMMGGEVGWAGWRGGKGERPRVLLEAYLVHRPLPPRAPVGLPPRASKETQQIQISELLFGAGFATARDLEEALFWESQKTKSLSPRFYRDRICPGIRKNLKTHWFYKLFTGTESVPVAGLPGQNLSR